MKHLKTFCQRYILLAFLLVVCKSLLAQTESQIEKLKAREGVGFVKSAQIRKEMANFSNFATEADKKNKGKLVKLAPWKTNKHSAIYGEGEFTVSMTIVNFIKKNHILKYGQYESTNGPGSFLYSIDKLPVWGKDGGIPTKEYKSIMVLFGEGEKRILLPKKAFKGLYEAEFIRTLSKNVFEAQCLVYRTEDRKRYYIFSMNSDGAGAYEVTWIFENGKYLRRVVDYGY